VTRIHDYGILSTLTDLFLHHLYSLVYSSNCSPLFLAIQNNSDVPVSHTMAMVDISNAVVVSVDCGGVPIIFSVHDDGLAVVLASRLSLRFEFR